MSELVPIDQEHFDVLRLAGTLDEKRKHIVLRVIAETANLKLACAAAGYKNTGAINKLRKTDAAFEEAFQEACEAAGDMLESEAVRRAVEGVRKPVWFKGEIVGHEVVYSDSLLTTLLKASKPDKYADRQKQETNINVKVGVAVIPMATKREDWEARSAIVHDEQKKLYAPPEQVIDATFTEVKPGSNPVTLSRG